VISSSVGTYLLLEGAERQIERKKTKKNEKREKLTSGTLPSLERRSRSE